MKSGKRPKEAYADDQQGRHSVHGIFEKNGIHRMPSGNEISLGKKGDGRW